MPQQQHDIPLLLSNGAQARAVRTGNNAAWLCPCGRDRPLLGYSGPADLPTTAALVVCPDCDAAYRVIAPTTRGVPTHVLQQRRVGRLARA